jgi:hypothetical protein
MPWTRVRQALGARSWIVVKLERKEKDSNCLEMTSRNRAKQIPLSAVLAGLKRLPIHVKRIGKYFAVRI